MPVLLALPLAAALLAVLAAALGADSRGLADGPAPRPWLP